MSLALSLKNAIKKLPLARYWLLPVTRLRAKRHTKRLRYEAMLFDRFYKSTFEMVESGSLVVRVPDLRGSFEIDFRSDILRRILRKKSYESDLVKLVDQYLDPAKDALDIGANIGLFTVLLAQRLTGSHKVLAVEPTPLALSYLRRNLIRNGVADSVIVYEGLVAEKVGRYSLKVIPGKEEYSSLGDMVHPSIVGQAYTVAQVEGETVDDLVTRFGLQPGLIKIDTEGAEQQVLCGARQTLLQYRPVLISELADPLLNTLGRSSSQVVEFLQELRYRIIDVNHPEKPVQAPFDGSILALPIELEPGEVST